MISEQEKHFVKEYKDLLEKHNVSLTVKKWSDEWGNHVDICFRELGTYCHINYSPEKNTIDRGHIGMGT